MQFARFGYSKVPRKVEVRSRWSSGKGRHDRRHLWSDGGLVRSRNEPERAPEELEGRQDRDKPRVQERPDIRGDPHTDVHRRVAPPRSSPQQSRGRQGGSVLRKGRARNDRGRKGLTEETDRRQGQGHHEGVGLEDGQRRREPAEGRPGLHEEGEGRQLRSREPSRWSRRLHVRDGLRRGGARRRHTLP